MIIDGPVGQVVEKISSLATDHGIQSVKFIPLTKISPDKGKVFRPSLGMVTRALAASRFLKLTGSLFQQYEVHFSGGVTNVHYPDTNEADTMHQLMEEFSPGVMSAPNISLTFNYEPKSTRRQLQGIGIVSCPLILATEAYQVPRADYLAESFFGRNTNDLAAAFFGGNASVLTVSLNPFALDYLEAYPELPGIYSREEIIREVNDPPRRDLLLEQVGRTLVRVPALHTIATLGHEIIRGRLK